MDFKFYYIILYFINKFVGKVLSWVLTWTSNSLLRKNGVLVVQDLEHA